MTRMSESKRRSVAAIGNSRVIPAQAGIQVGDLSVSALLNWAPAYAGATMEASALPNWAPACAGATMEASALPDRAPACAGSATIVNRLVSALPFVAT